MLHRYNKGDVQRQEATDGYFKAAASFWKEVYADSSVLASVYQDRLRVVLEFVDRVGLAQSSDVLDVGCGAGYAAAALARRGYMVEAVDPVEEMVESTHKLAVEAGLEHRLNSRKGDIHGLPFPDGTFALVLAIGVLPWLPSIECPVREMCRVLRPGGYLITTVDNRWAVRWVLEPRTSPLLRPARDLVKRVMWSARREPAVQARGASMGELDAVIRASGMEKVAAVTLGFGPLTVFNREFLGPSTGQKLHRCLQGLADRGFPVLRNSGSHYVVLARKESGLDGLAPGQAAGTAPG